MLQGWPQEGGLLAAVGVWPSRLATTLAAVCGAFFSGLSSCGQAPFSTWADFLADGDHGVDEAVQLLQRSLSVGSTISVLATGKLSVGAWKP